jgi:Protein kinase domain
MSVGRPDMSTIEHTSFAGYEVQQVLYQDALGEVCAATSPIGTNSRLTGLDSANRVTLRFLSTQLQLDETRVIRFLVAMRRARELDHRNIVKIFEVNRDKGRNFVVEERIEHGIRLSRILAEGLSTAEIGYLVGKVLCALCYAHECEAAKRVVHHGISPERIFVTREGEVKLFGFGVEPIAGVGAGAVVQDNPTIDLRATGELLNTLLGSVARVPKAIAELQAGLRCAGGEGSFVSARQALHHLDQWGGYRDTRSELSWRVSTLASADAHRVLETKPLREPELRSVPTPAFEEMRGLRPTLPLRERQPRHATPPTEGETTRTEPVPGAVASSSRLDASELPEQTGRPKEFRLKVMLVGLLIPVVTFVGLSAYLFTPLGETNRVKLGRWMVNDIGPAAPVEDVQAEEAQTERDIAMAKRAKKAERDMAERAERDMAERAERAGRDMAERAEKTEKESKNKNKNKTNKKAPKSGAPETPKSGAPETPKSGAPETPKSGAPETPKSGAPEAPKSGAPEAPKRAAPATQQPTIQNPTLGTKRVSPKSHSISSAEMLADRN